MSNKVTKYADHTKLLRSLRTNADYENCLIIMTSYNTELLDNKWQMKFSVYKCDTHGEEQS